jgi:uncharacterized phage protein (TIGR02216 family)
MSRFDWPGVMRLGMVDLGLAPEVFWRLTPAELQLLAGPAPGAARLSRARLDEMVRAFPDGNARGDDERDCKPV